jgi:hypothetical protein
MNDFPEPKGHSFMYVYAFEDAIIVISLFVLPAVGAEVTGVLQRQVKQQRQVLQKRKIISYLIWTWTSL